MMGMVWPVVRLEMSWVVQYLDISLGPHCSGRSSILSLVFLNDLQMLWRSMFPRLENSRWSRHGRRSAVGMLRGREMRSFYARIATSCTTAESEVNVDVELEGQNPQRRGE